MKLRDMPYVALRWSTCGVRPLFLEANRWTEGPTSPYVGPPVASDLSFLKQTGGPRHYVALCRWSTCGVRPLSLEANRWTEALRRPTLENRPIPRLTFTNSALEFLSPLLSSSGRHFR